MSIKDSLFLPFLNIRKTQGTCLSVFISLAKSGHRASRDTPTLEMGPGRFPSGGCCGVHQTSSFMMLTSVSLKKITFVLVLQGLSYIMVNMEAQPAFEFTLASVFSRVSLYT